MICKMGWDSLSAGTDNLTEKDDVKDFDELREKYFTIDDEIKFLDLAYDSVLN